MYSIANKSEQCIDCLKMNTNSHTNDGWFICQDCYQIFCSQHCIIHRHDSSREEPLPIERYNRHVHLDQIAEWERKAIEKIRRQANEARRPLIAPPTPITPPSPSSTTLVNQLNPGPFTRLVSLSLSKTNEQVSTMITSSSSPTIDQFELLSDETLDELIGDGRLTSPPNETKIPGRISFASQIPYINGRHHLRLLIDKFQTPLSWAFVGIISEGLRREKPENQIYFNRSSFGWHLGRQSIIHDRQMSISFHYDGRDIRQGDILRILIDCDSQTIEMKNERTLYTHIIGIDSHCCPLPWLFAVNFNYQHNDSMYLLR